MKKIENECVGCPQEMGCIGNACPYKRVTHFYCDQCGEDGAMYVIDNEDLCEECAEKYLEEVFRNEYTISEKAKMLKIQMISRDIV